METRLSSVKSFEANNRIMFRLLARTGRIILGLSEIRLPTHLLDWDMH